MVVKIACKKGGGKLLHCAPNHKMHVCMRAEIKGDEKLLLDLEGPNMYPAQLCGGFRVFEFGGLDQWKGTVEINGLDWNGGMEWNGIQKVTEY